jgi:hypothetical protein
MPLIEEFFIILCLIKYLAFRPLVMIRFNPESYIDEHNENTCHVLFVTHKQEKLQ